MRTIPQYTPEFKADAVALLRRTDCSLPEIARRLGVSIFSLRSWYKASEMGKKKPKKPPRRAPSSSSIVPVSPQDELHALRRENAALRKENDDLKEDREILKKAAAFFAKESE